MLLADYLKQHSLTQEQAAQLFGCTQGRISQLVSGERPSLRLAQRIELDTAGQVGLSDWPASNDSEGG